MPHWKNVLGYQNGNNLTSLRTKFRRLSMLRHPNRNGGSTTAFQELLSAWHKAQESMGNNWRRDHNNTRRRTPPPPPTPAPPRRNRTTLIIQTFKHLPGQTEPIDGVLYLHHIALNQMSYKRLYKTIARQSPGATYITANFENLGTQYQRNRQVSAEAILRFPAVVHTWVSPQWTHDLPSQWVFDVEKKKFVYHYRAAAARPPPPNRRNNNRYFLHPRTGAHIGKHTPRGRILGALQAGMRCTFDCASDEICNPATMRCVKRSSELGRFLVSLGLR